MPALYNVYAIDASEEDTKLKEEVSSLSGQVKYLHEEKAKVERERESLKKQVSSLTSKVEKLGELQKRVPELEGMVGELKELEPLRDAEEKANSWKAKAEFLEGRVPEERLEAVEEYKASSELAKMLLNAQDKAIIPKYREWVAAGYMDEAKFKRGALERKKKQQEAASKGSAGGSQSTAHDQ